MNSYQEKERLRSEFSRFVEECPTATSIFGIGAFAVSLFGGSGLADKISDPTIGALACGALTATGAGIAALSLNLPLSKKANALFISVVACAGGAFGFSETFSNSSNTTMSSQLVACGNKKEGQEVLVVCTPQ